jgi:hypothetical protein
MAMKLTPKHKVMMSVAGAGVLFVIYDQTVNLGPQRSAAAEPAAHALPGAGPLSTQQGKPEITPEELVTSSVPTATDRLETLRIRMGALPESSQLRDIFAAKNLDAAHGGRRGSGSQGGGATGSEPGESRSTGEMDPQRAERLAKLFVLRSVLNTASGASASVNDTLLLIGRPARVRELGTAPSGRESVLELVSVAEPERGDRGSALMRIDGELVRLHLSDEQRR